MGYDELEPFLNGFFESVSEIPLVGVAFYALFSFYLLACVIKGTIKLGMRIFFFTLHPMRVGETFMNSMLFNVGIILICSLAVVQFLTLAFMDYASYTAISCTSRLRLLFSVFLSYLFILSFTD